MGDCGSYRGSASILSRNADACSLTSSEISQVSSRKSTSTEDTCSSFGKRLTTLSMIIGLTALKISLGLPL